MVIGAHTVFSCATNFLNGRKCVFCGSFKTVKTARSYVKCMLCGKQKSLSKLRREIAILQGFYQQQPAYRLASDLGLDAKTITRVYQRLRMVLFHTAELEGAKLSGEIEMDESYFGGAKPQIAKVSFKQNSRFSIIPNSKKLWFFNFPHLNT
ncbi:MAG: hypothetical protein EB024_04400 [Burkholderiaceae bacterium]|nr:hypothetical protein [Burkholderiaceae bacterium]